MSLLYRTIAN